MTKGKRILALLMALVMFSTAFCTSAFARQADPDLYKTDPYSGHLNEIDKFELTAGEGASQVLDMLDELLYGLNLNFDNEVLTSVAIIGDIKLTAHLRNIDEVFWTLYNAVTALADGDKTCLGNIIAIGGLSSGLVSTVLGILNLGDVKDLNVSALGNQNSNARVGRKWPAVPLDSKMPTVSIGADDMTILAMLLQFLADNAHILKKIVTGDISFGLLDGTIKGISDVTEKLFNNFSGFLADTLYGVLWDSSADAAPSDFNWDTYLQKVVDWALVTGTGETAATGANSVLGPNFEGFLPAIATYDKGASISDQSVYHLVNNAIKALLSGMVGDLLSGLLIDLLGIDAEANDGKGDTAIMNDTLYNTIIGAIEGLCTANGAPAITWTAEEQTYPIPQINKLLNWFFDGGGLATFVKIDVNGIALTDNLVSLLGDVIRILPGLFPLFGFEVPEDIKIDTETITATVTDEVKGDIYATFEGEQIYFADPDNISYDGSGNIDFESNVMYYVSSDSLVNTTDSSRNDYRNPKFIRQARIMSNNEVYAYIVKILLNNFIEGCYFPEWANSIPSVTAYALASVAAKYIPENDYYDRLDAYHAQQIGETYRSRGANGTVTPLPYEETVTLSSGRTVTVPRASANIGASLGAFFLNGEFTIEQGLSSTVGTGKFATDTTFETFVFEFLTWGVRKFMPALVGTFDAGSNKFTDVYTGVTPVFNSAMNKAWTAYSTLLKNNPNTSMGSYYRSNLDPNAVRPILAQLLDDTIFTLIPMKILPNWLLPSKGSPAEEVAYNWFADSISNFDLQKIISLLQANTDSDAILQQSVVVVIIRVLDRVLGTVVGGNPLLPSISRTNVYVADTSITKLNDILGSNDNLAILVEQLLLNLNKYGKTLFSTIFVLLAASDVKSATYADTAGGTATNHLNNTQITIDMLQEYYDKLEADQNAVKFSGKLLYQSAAKAAQVASDIGIADYNADSNIVIADGATRYAVEIPESFTLISQAEKAAAAASGAETLDGTLGTCYVGSKRAGLRTTYFVLEKLDYLTETATMTPVYTRDANGNVTSTTYQFTNFHVATVKTASNGSLRTGPRGEVQYNDGYKALYTEDFSSATNYKYLRYSDSIRAAGDQIDAFHTYAESTLPGAYGDWVMYFIRMRLLAAGLYDKDGNNVFDATVDTNVDTPSSMLPFTAASGNSTVKGYAPTQTYMFNATASSLVVQAAIEYASDPENNVTFNVLETQDIVRLAINNIKFDITKDEDGNYGNGTIQWTDLTAAQKSSINSLCNTLGFTYNDDGEDSTISRKAFALFTTNMLSGTNFGNYYTYKTNDDGVITGVDTTTAISLTPITDAVLGAADADKVKTTIHDAYTDFASGIKEMDNSLNDYYDDMSWRAENMESYINGNAKMNTLKFVLSLTAKAYNPVNSGINKTYDNEGVLVPAYSKSSFDAFQKAYEYGTQLLAYSASNPVRQSLVSTVYQNIMATYKRLEAYSGRADWTELVNYLNQAKEILEGPLGVDANGIVKDAENGYTQATLDRLIAAVNSAQDLYDINYTTFDSEMQETVDLEAIDLYGVIEALEFQPGVAPDLKLVADYVGDLDLKKTTNDGSRQLGIISGLEEGTGLNNTIIDDSIYVTGFSVDGNANRAELQSSGYGFGTGSYYRVYNTNSGEVVRYYAVLKGDLNGDARIDGNDKVILDIYDAQALNTTLADYLQAAADVDANGEINFDDIAKIKAHYTYASQNGISGSVDGTIDQTVAIVIVGE